MSGFTALASLPPSPTCPCALLVISCSRTSVTWFLSLCVFVWAQVCKQSLAESSVGNDSALEALTNSLRAAFADAPEAATRAVYLFALAQLEVHASAVKGAAIGAPHATPELDLFTACFIVRSLLSLGHVSRYCVLLRGVGQGLVLLLLS